MQNLEVFRKKVSAMAEELRAVSVCVSQEGSQLSTFSPALFRLRHHTQCCRLLFCCLNSLRDCWYSASFQRQTFPTAFILTLWNGSNYILNLLRKQRFCLHLTVLPELDECFSPKWHFLENFDWFKGQFCQRYKSFEVWTPREFQRTESFQNKLWKLHLKLVPPRTSLYPKARERKRKKSVFKHPVLLESSRLERSCVVVLWLKVISIMCSTASCLHWTVCLAFQKLSTWRKSQKSIHLSSIWSHRKKTVSICFLMSRVNVCKT